MAAPRKKIVVPVVVDGIDEGHAILDPDGKMQIELFTRQDWGKTLYNNLRPKHDALLYIDVIAGDRRSTNARIPRQRNGNGSGVHDRDGEMREERKGI